MHERFYVLVVHFSTVGVQPYMIEHLVVYTHFTLLFIYLRDKMDLSMASSPFVDDPREPRNNSYNTPSRTPTRTLHLSSEEKQLREEIQALKYELESLKNEREHEQLRHETMVRSLEARVQQEGKRVDELESDQVFLFNKQKETADALLKARDERNREKANFESNIQRLRSELDEAVTGRDDAESKLRSNESYFKKQVGELELRNQNLQTSLDSLGQELIAASGQISVKQQTILDQEQELNSLRTESQKLKSEIGQVESAEIIQRELDQQISYIHKLEDQVARQETELKDLKDSKLVVDVILEEKESLEAKLRQLEDTRDQLNRLELQNMELLQEQEQWRLFLEKDDTFNSPQEIVRALMMERMEKVQLLEKLGRLEADLATNSSQGDNYSSELSQLKEELKTAKANLDKEIKTRMRFQRQKELATKEADFLRDQLKVYDNEEMTLMKDNYDAAKSLRITELQSMIDQLKTEIAKLSRELAERDDLVATLQSPKRPASRFGDKELLSETQRKFRNAQVELEKAQLRVRELEKGNNILQQQAQHKEESKYRILELKANPTAKHEAVKLQMLESLKRENEDLLQQLKGNALQSNFVPVSALDRVRREIKEARHNLAEQEKRVERLKSVFSKKSLEFRESVNALLGYKVDLLPNKKVRATSIYATSEDESFTFISDPSTKNKFIAIDDNPAIQEYENLITFWIKERNDIPCFLAAINLELYERTTKAARF